MRCDYDIAEARRVTGFQGRFHWNKLNRTELQCYEYDYQLHLAKQAAQRKDRNQFADSSSLPNMLEVESDESETEQPFSAVLPRTVFDSSEWYGPPGSTDGISDSDAEAPLPTSLTRHPDVSLAAAIQSRSMMLQQ